MSNKPDETEQIVTCVYFKEPVVIGSHGQDEWLLETHGKTTNGRSTVEDKGQRIVFTYTSATVTQIVDVPISNVRHITRVVRPKAAAVKP